MASGLLDAIPGVETTINATNTYNRILLPQLLAHLMTFGTCDVGQRRRRQAYENPLPNSIERIIDIPWFSCLTEAFENEMISDSDEPPL